MECNDLLLEKEDHIAVMTLNRPKKLNAISGEMREFLPLALQEVQNDEEMRVLIITGAGRGFCSGADVSVQAARAAGQQEAILSKNGQLMRPDGKLWIVPIEGGEPRLMRCNTYGSNGLRAIGRPAETSLTNAT